MKDLISQFLLLSGSKLLRIPTTILTIGLLSRLVGPIGVGKWAMVVAVATFFFSFLIGWTQGQAVRFGREEWLNTARLSRTWAARWPLLCLGFCLALLIMLWRPWGIFERISNLPSSWWPLPLIYLFGLWCFSEAQILMQTTGKFAYLAALPLISDAVIIAFLLLLPIAIPEVNDLTVIVGMVVVTAGVSASVLIFEFVGTRSWGGRPHLEDMRQVTGYGLPLAVAAFFGYFSDWGDHFLLQHFLGSKDVGLFQAGNQMMTAMMALSAPLSIIFVPKLVDQLRVNRNAEETFLGRVVPMISALWLLLVFPGIAIAPWVFFGIFGENFQGSAPVLLVLCIAIPGAIISNLYSVLFNVQGRSGAPALFIAVMAILNLAISLFLVPSFGIVGAAIGTTVSYLVLQWLFLWSQHRYLSMSLKIPLLLFLVSTSFGILQWMVGSSFLLRIVLSIASMGVIVFLVRHYSILEKGTVDSVLPEGFHRLSIFIDKIFLKM